jgi:hypothetical protein
MSDMVCLSKAWGAGPALENEAVVVVGSAAFIYADKGAEIARVFITGWPRSDVCSVSSCVQFVNCL